MAELFIKPVWILLFGDDSGPFRSDFSLFKKVCPYIEKENLVVLTVNSGLEELSRWFRCNKLTLNLKKTEYMFFGQQDPSQERLVIGGEVIKRVEGARFLGVWIDHELKWTEHINRVKSKVVNS